MYLYNGDHKEVEFNHCIIQLAGGALGVLVCIASGGDTVNLASLLALASKY